MLGLASLAGQVSQPPQQDEFVPMSEVPPEEQLPAAPLLVAAYAFVWVAVLLYIVSVARRLTAVQGELQRLERNLNETRRV
jgi:CcmD family protein